MDQPKSSSPARGYRPDIDGLRAVAVTLVVNFHGFPEALPGGFVGVDIFFVISGFLITGIIARELDQQRFSLAGFYARRVRRIFPALIVVLAATLVLGWLWMLPMAYAQLSADVVASGAFFSNFAQLAQSGYFDIESSKKPLLHLWSLGIEEQFYLFWPLLLMAASRLRLNMLAVAVAIALASFALNVALIGSNPVATFYLPFTRAWELAVGAGLACGWDRISQTSAASNLRATIGIALIAVSVGLLDTHSAFPGWWAALPVAGAALLLSAPAAWGCRHLLASRPMVWIGLVSYPMYLWHWPLLVFFTIIKFGPLTLLERELVLQASLLLAALTYLFVEKPFRSHRPSQLRIAGLCATMVLISAAGGIVVYGQGFDFRMPAEIRAMADVRTDSSKWRFHECLLDTSREMTFAESCVDRDRRPLVMLWGDSTAAALLPGLRQAQQTHNFGIAQFTASSCVPALDTDVAREPNCRAINDKVLALARKLQPDVVLLHAAWGGHFDGVAKTVAALKQQTAARVVVLGSVPWWKGSLPNEVLRYYMLHHRLIPVRSGGAELDNSAPALRAKVVPAGAEFISVWNVMCNADGCLTRIGDSTSDIATSDQVHLTEKASVFLIQSVIDGVLGQSPRSGKVSQ
jgi:peptidoglycan/LPS O-acetylase OafA/YrhL